MWLWVWVGGDCYACAQPRRVYPLLLLPATALPTASLPSLPAVLAITLPATACYCLPLPAVLTINLSGHNVDTEVAAGNLQAGGFAYMTLANLPQQSHLFWYAHPNCSCCYSLGALHT